MKKRGKQRTEQVPSWSNSSKTTLMMKETPIKVASSMGKVKVRATKIGRKLTNAGQEAKKMPQRYKIRPKAV